MKIYYGKRRDDGTCTVFVAEESRPGIRDIIPRELPTRLDLRNHSPTGFGWGYGGSGPSQLALALLCDALGDDALAQELYQEFKWLRVSLLPDEWVMPEKEIKEAVATLNEGQL